MQELQPVNVLYPTDGFWLYLPGLGTYAGNIDLNGQPRNVRKLNKGGDAVAVMQMSSTGEEERPSPPAIEQDKLRRK